MISIAFYFPSAKFSHREEPRRLFLERKEKYSSRDGSANDKVIRTRSEVTIVEKKGKEHYLRRD